MKLVGITLKEFAKDKGIDIKDQLCTRCNSICSASDYDIEKDLISIYFKQGHAENCDNGGPVKCIVDGKLKESLLATIGSLW